MMEVSDKKSQVSSAITRYQFDRYNGHHEHYDDDLFIIRLTEHLTRELGQDWRSRAERKSNAIKKVMCVCGIAGEHMKKCINSIAFMLFIYYAKETGTSAGNETPKTTETSLNLLEQGTLTFS